MERQEAIESLVKAANERDYGDVMTFAEIGGIINQKYGTQRYSDILQAARKRLIAAGHMIVNVRGIGYKVCPPDGYTNEGVRHIRRGAREIDRGAEVISHAPVNDMTQAAREAHNRVSDRVVLLRAAMAGTSVELNLLSKPQHPLLATK